MNKTGAAFINDHSSFKFLEELNYIFRVVIAT